MLWRSRTPVTTKPLIKQVDCLPFAWCEGSTTPSSKIKWSNLEVSFFLVVFEMSPHSESWLNVLSWSQIICSERLLPGVRVAKSALISLRNWKETIAVTWICSVCVFFLLQSLNSAFEGWNSNHSLIFHLLFEQKLKKKSSCVGCIYQLSLFSYQKKISWNQGIK